MNHFTNFFTKLKEYFKDLDVTIRVKEKNDRYTVMVIPEVANANNLKALTITGTAKELDDDFFGKVQEAVSVVEGLTSNIQEVKKDAADLAAAAADKKAAKPAPPTKKEKPAKDKPAKNKAKDARKAKPKPAEPPVPEQRDIFSQGPAEEPASEDAAEPAPEEKSAEPDEERDQDLVDNEAELITDDDQPE